MSLDAYNSKYPLAYYELGTAYAFYRWKETNHTLREATKAEITEFKGVLTKAKKGNAFDPESGEWEHFRRVIGVVIDKYTLVERELEDGNFETVRCHDGEIKDDDKITASFLIVLFEDAGKYLVLSYVAERDQKSGVFFDDKEYVRILEKKCTTGLAPDAVTGPVPDAVTGPVPETVTGPVPEKKASGPVPDTEAENF